MSDYEALFKKELLFFHKKQAEVLVKEYRKNIEKLLLKTINPSDKGFKGAFPKFTYKITETPKGVRITVHALVANSATGGKHLVWHFINAGRTITPKENRVVPVGNRQARTTVKSFNFRQKNTSVKFITLKKGKQYSWDGRNWYELVAETVDDTLLVRKDVSQWNGKIEVLGNG